MGERMLRIPADVAERGVLGQVLGQAFGFPPADAEGWFARAGFDQLRVLQEGDELLGGLLRVPMGIFLGGRSVPMLGIAGVGVRAEARRRGVASALMAAVLTEAREEGMALSGLYASNQPLYRGVGYEQAGSRFLAKIRPGEIAIDERGLRTRSLGEADEPALFAFYQEQIGPAFSGHLDRGRYVWQRVLRLRSGERVHGLLLENEQGRIEGYLVYHQERQGTDIRPVINITDIGAATARAGRALWTLIADLASLARLITLQTSPTDPLYALQPHPRLEMRLHENWMLRIVDLPAAIRARGWPAGIESGVDIEVTDPLGLCNGRFRIEVGGAEGRATPGGKGEVRLDVRGLATVFSGFRSPLEAARLGLAEGHADALSRLGTLLAGPAPWMREMF